MAEIYVKNPNLRKRGWIMSNDQKIESIISAVNKLPIADVLANHGVKLERGSGHEIQALCPFHMDESLGSFSIDTDKNMCWCFACSNGGGVVKSMMNITHEDYIKTALIVAADEKVISQDEFKTLSGVEYTGEFVKKTDSDYKFIKRKKRKDSKTLKMWNAVYGFMKDWWGLSDEDREYLLTERQLSPERVDADYFSINTTDSAQVSRFIYHLKKEFPEYQSELSKIPGFFEELVKKGRNGEEDVYKLQMLHTDGIAILIRNGHGTISGVQVRKREMTEEEKRKKISRYKFMSYEFVKNSIYRGGGSCETPIDVLYPEKIGNPTKFAVVEGRFKSEILAQQGLISVSVQGVNNYSGIEKEIKEIEAVTKIQLEKMYIFYDADMARNANVFKAAISLGEYIHEVRPDIQVIYSVWNDIYGKGIDDMIFAGYRQEVKFKSFDFMKETLTACMDQAVIDANIDVNNLINTSKEDRIAFLDALEKRVKAAWEV